MRNKLLTEEKDKWLSVITIDFMSSEESGPDDDIYVNPLPWRSDHVTRMFAAINKYMQEKKTPMKKRCADIPSNRSMQISAPDWAVNSKG